MLMTFSEQTSHSQGQLSKSPSPQEYNLNFMIGTCCVDVEQTNCINTRTAGVSKIAFLGLRGVAMVTGDLCIRRIVPVVSISPILFSI